MVKRLSRQLMSAALTALPLLGLLSVTPARAQFTPFETAIAEFDAAVAAGVA
ncbi:MAG: hypothetical protein GTO46_16725, partial [Gemmatimonadetes bacterium]|nr:hypothetical protein [Gemmatimonadota bacterium]NIO33354.1 hypothetical protein [Gemmatimonadota bacterium]